MQECYCYRNIDVMMFELRLESHFSIWQTEKIERKFQKAIQGNRLGKNAQHLVHRDPVTLSPCLLSKSTETLKRYTSVSRLYNSQVDEQREKHESSSCE